MVKQRRSLAEMKQIWLREIEHLQRCVAKAEAVERIKASCVSPQEATLETLRNMGEKL